MPQERRNELVIRKVDDSRCPVCKQIQLEAIEVDEGNVSSYSCKTCGAYYDTEICHDYDRDEHWWIGKLRNPDYWNLEPNSLFECLVEMEKKTRQGVIEYLGRYQIERIEI